MATVNNSYTWYFGPDGGMYIDYNGERRDVSILDTHGSDNSEDWSVVDSQGHVFHPLSYYDSINRTREGNRNYISRLFDAGQEFHYADPSQYRSGYHSEDVLPFANALTGGMLYKLRPSQTIGGIRDTYRWLTGKMDTREWLDRNFVYGNNGVFSDEFARRNPRTTQIVNGAIDLASLLGWNKLSEALSGSAMIGNGMPTSPRGSIGPSGERTTVELLPSGGGSTNSNLPVVVSGGNTGGSNLPVVVSGGRTVSGVPATTASRGTTALPATASRGTAAPPATTGGSVVLSNGVNPIPVERSLVTTGRGNTSSNLPVVTSSSERGLTTTGGGLVPTGGGNTNSNLPVLAGERSLVPAGERSIDKFRGIEPAGGYYAEEEPIHLEALPFWDIAPYTNRETGLDLYRQFDKYRQLDKYRLMDKYRQVDRFRGMVPSGGGNLATIGERGLIPWGSGVVNPTGMIVPPSYIIPAATAIEQSTRDDGNYGGGSYGGAGAGGRWNNGSGAAKEKEKDDRYTIMVPGATSKKSLKTNNKKKKKSSRRNETPAPLPAPKRTIPGVQGPSEPVHVVPIDVPETALIVQLPEREYYNRRKTREYIRQRGLNPYHQGSLLRKQLRKYLNGQIQKVSPTVLHIADREVVPNKVWNNYHLSSGPLIVKDLKEFFRPTVTVNGE